MSRLDRRGRSGEESNTDLRTLSDKDVANKTILPQHVNGDLRTNNMDIPLNRSAQRLGFQRKGSSKISNLENRNFNRGGVSPLFGTRIKQ